MNVGFENFYHWLKSYFVFTESSLCQGNELKPCHRFGYQGYQSDPRRKWVSESQKVCSLFGWSECRLWRLTDAHRHQMDELREVLGEVFFVLRTEIPVFLEESIRCDASTYCSKLRDTDFLWHGIPCRHYFTSQSPECVVAGKRPNSVRSLCAHECISAQTSPVQSRLFSRPSKFGTLSSLWRNAQRCPWMRDNTSHLQSWHRKTAATVPGSLSGFRRHAAPDCVICLSPLCCCHWATPRVAAWTVWTAVRPLLPSKVQWEWNLILETFTSVPLSAPQGFCPLNGQHVWEHLHLREQLLNNEAQKIQREKQTDETLSSSCRLDAQTLILTFSLMYVSRRGQVSHLLYNDPPVGQG